MKLLSQHIAMGLVKLCLSDDKNGKSDQLVCESCLKPGRKESGLVGGPNY